MVHGVPDTYRIWDQVRRRLTRKDVRVLALPGFDSPVPAGFDATKEAYVDWIIARLSEESEPVDLVGHDWGCILTVRVASIRPDLIRTWAGGSGPVSAEYDWHPWAKIWQTPGEGERWMRDLDPAAFTQLLVRDYGVPAKSAAETVSRMDDTMKDCILRLYRSAVHVGREWEPELANITAPALVFWGVDDIGCPVAFADRLAVASRGSLLRLDANHWTLLQRPEEIAKALNNHWAIGDKTLSASSRTVSTYE